MKDIICKLFLQIDCSFCLSNLMFSMSPEIISVYTKVWKTGFAVSFLHDSAHCPHCMNGGINISRIKEPLQANRENAKDEEPPKSIFEKQRRKALVVRNDSIPENCFSALGIKLTNQFYSELVQSNELKVVKNELNDHHPDKSDSPIKCKRKRLQRRFSKRKVLADCKYGKRTCVARDIENKKSLFKKTKNGIHKELCKSILSKIPILKISPQKTYKTVKKEDASPKDKKSKEPRAGTLKWKRWKLGKIKDFSSCYEDDLFENKKFLNFKPMTEDDTDSDKYDNMKTPKISLSPVREGSNSPTYDDCYSPNELFINRKDAEEYIYRRAKRRKLKLLDEGSESNKSPDYRNSPEYTKKTLEETCKILQQAMMKSEDLDSEEEKDDYFSDVSD